MAKENIFGFVDNTDYLQEAQEREEKEKELESLKYFLECQEELAKILVDGWGCGLNDDGLWEIESATGNFKGTGKTYRDAFFDMYYAVIEWQEQQEDEDETYFGESRKYWRDYWGKKEREWIESSSDDDFRF